MTARTKKPLTTDEMLKAMRKECLRLAAAAGADVGALQRSESEIRALIENANERISDVQREVQSLSSGVGACDSLQSVTKRLNHIDQLLADHERRLGDLDKPEIGGHAPVRDSIAIAFSRIGMLETRTDNLLGSINNGIARDTKNSNDIHAMATRVGALESRVDGLDKPTDFNRSPALVDRVDELFSRVEALTRRTANLWPELRRVETVAVQAKAMVNDPTRVPAESSEAAPPADTDSDIEGAREFLKRLAHRIKGQAAIIQSQRRQLEAMGRTASIEDGAREARNKYISALENRLLHFISSDSLQAIARMSGYGQ